MVVFLNRHGGTYRPGANDGSRNLSSIIGRARTIPAYEGGDRNWQTLVECVRHQFNRFNVVVTDVEPTAGNYVETVIGGYPSNLGLSGGITGIAPIDTYSCAPIENAVAYVFSANIGSLRGECETTAHEIGHTISLEHEYLCADPMTYLWGCGEKEFQDTTAWCGTGSSVRCACRGGQQNTVQAMFDLIGTVSGETPPDPSTDTEPPVAEIVSPADGDTLVENGTIDVIARATDDQWLARVELVWDYNGKRYACPTNEQYVTCTRTGDEMHWVVKISTGERTFRVRAIDLAGQEVLTDSRTVKLTPDGLPRQPPPPELIDSTAPVVQLVAPADGTRQDPQTDVEVVVQITDDVALDRVQLIWDFNGMTYGCPSSSQHVDCTQSGDAYTWRVRVGAEADRVYRIKAFDTAGNETTSETRTVEVRAIRDELAPAVEIVAPAIDATLLANTELSVTAVASDETGLSDVELIWDFNSQVYPCPHASTYVDCAVSGDRFEWKVRVGTGSRTFRVRAKDTAGNETVTPDRRYTLQP